MDKSDVAGNKEVKLARLQQQKEGEKLPTISEVCGLGDLVRGVATYRVKKPGTAMLS